MNNRKPPFHFDEGSNIDRRSDIWKRFGFNPEEDRRMFCESSPTNHGWPDWQSKFHRPPQFEDPEWRNRSVFTEPGSSSPSFGRRMRMGPNWVQEDDIPIRVVHEKTPPMEDGNDSETSSQASHGSQGSSASGNGQPMRAKITREPRVHHIPIMVEPRDGSTSSGYASDSGGGNQMNPNHPNSNKQTSSSNLSKQNSVDSNMDTEDYPAPNVQQLKKNFEQGHSPDKRKDSSVRTIPIKVLHEESQGANPTSPKSRQPPARSFSANSFGSSHTEAPISPRQRKASSHPPMSTPSSNGRANGPHVTKVPVNVQNQKREISPEPTTQKESNSRIKPTRDPLEDIKTVLDELDRYKTQIDSFQGKSQDKAYKYLDEMLTRLMLKLDNVETGGQDNIRQARKAAVREIEKWISVLESKACSPDQGKTNVEETSQQSDAATTNEALEGQKADEEAMAIDQKNEEEKRQQSRAESMETDLQKTSSTSQVSPPATEIEKAVCPEEQ